MPDSNRELKGVLPVFQTPFNEDETIDAATLEKEINWLYDQGSDGIVMAMVSETLRLSTDEREHLAELSTKFGRKRGVVIISVGAESSKLAERYSKHAEAVGADAVMAIPPVPSNTRAFSCVASRNSESFGPIGVASGLNCTRTGPCWCSSFACIAIGIGFPT